MLKFQDLQKKAKGLGINSKGMTKEDLEKAVGEKMEVESEAVEAIVTNGGMVVRKYSEKVHGENFKDLAREFAKKKGYKVELSK